VSFVAQQRLLHEQLAGHAFEWAALREGRLVAIAPSLDDLEGHADVLPTDTLMVIPPEVDDHGSRTGQ
jgi:hypothetical protein